MRKTPIAIFIGGLAIAVAVTLLTAPSSNGEQPAPKRSIMPPREETYAQSSNKVMAAAVPVVVFAPLYGSSPRIIQVPQADARAGAIANTDEENDEAIGTIDHADAPPPPPPIIRRIRPAPQN